MICVFQDECIMDHETDGDGAINLSTSQRPSAATTPNGNIEYDEQDQVSIITYFWGVLALPTIWCRIVLWMDKGSSDKWWIKRMNCCV